VALAAPEHMLCPRAGEDSPVLWKKLADRWLGSIDAILAIPAIAGKPAISHRPANRSPVVPFGIGVAGNSCRRATKEVAPMDLRIRIENVLTRLRPYLQADGGDI
jgi:hypothetical protein